LLPRHQLCSLRRLDWLLVPYGYRHGYFLVSSMSKLSSLKPSKYTHWIFASIDRFVTGLKCVEISDVTGPLKEKCITVTLGPFESKVGQLYIAVAAGPL